MKFDDDNNREYIKPDLFLHSIDKKLKVDLSTNRKLIYPQIGGDLISHRNPMEDSGQKQDQDWTSVFTQQVKKPIKVDDHGSLCLQVFLI